MADCPGCGNRLTPRPTGILEALVLGWGADVYECRLINCEVQQISTDGRSIGHYRLAQRERRDDDD